MYDRWTTRFTSRDPLPAPGEPVVLSDNNWFGERLTAMRSQYGYDSSIYAANRYTYAANNPLRYRDPSGLTISDGPVWPWPSEEPQPDCRSIFGPAIPCNACHPYYAPGNYAAPTPFKGHRKGKRKSTQGKHEKGDTRRGRDQRRGGKGEKGDVRRPYIIVPPSGSSVPFVDDLLSEFDS